MSPHRDSVDLGSFVDRLGADDQKKFTSALSQLQQALDERGIGRNETTGSDHVESDSEGDDSTKSGKDGSAANPSEAGKHSTITFDSSKLDQLSKEELKIAVENIRFKLLEETGLQEQSCQEGILDTDEKTGKMTCFPMAKLEAARQIWKGWFNHIIAENDTNRTMPSFGRSSSSTNNTPQGDDATSHVKSSSGSYEASGSTTTDNANAISSGDYHDMNHDMIASVKPHEKPFAEYNSEFYEQDMRSYEYLNELKEIFPDIHNDGKQHPDDTPPLTLEEMHDLYDRLKESDPPILIERTLPGRESPFHTVEEDLARMDKLWDNQERWENANSVIGGDKSQNQPTWFHSFAYLNSKSSDFDELPVNMSYVVTFYILIGMSIYQFAKRWIKRRKAMYSVNAGRVMNVGNRNSVGLLSHGTARDVTLNPDSNTRNGDQEQEQELEQVNRQRDGQQPLLNKRLQPEE